LNDLSSIPVASVSSRTVISAGAASALVGAAVLAAGAFLGQPVSNPAEITATATIKQKKDFFIIISS
jgi:hypothetical protein